MDDPTLLTITGIHYFVISTVLVLFLLRQSGSDSLLYAARPATIFLFVVAVLGIAGVLTLALGPDHVLFAVGFAPALLLSLFSPVVGCASMVSALVARPWELAPPESILTAVPKLISALCLTSWVISVMRSPSPVVVWNRTCTLFLLFSVWTLLSILAAGSETKALENYYESFYPIAVLCFTVLNAPKTTTDLRLILVCMLIASIAVVTTSLYYTWSTTGFGGGNRLVGAGFWGNSNDLGALICLTLPFAVYLSFTNSSGVFSKCIGAVSIVVLLSGLWASQSRGSMIALCIAMGAYFIFCARLTPKRILLFCIVGLIAAAFFFSIQRNASDLADSSTSRMNFVIAGLRMLKASPIFGIGMGYYEQRYEQFAPAFTEWGKRTAHSSWVLAFAETGGIGFLIFLALCFIPLRASWRMRVKRPEYFLAVVSYGTAMSFLSHTFLFLPYLLFALVLAAHRIAVPEPPAVEEKRSPAFRPGTVILPRSRFPL